jgi:hypothetical protein
LGLKIAVADADESGLRAIGQELVEMLGAQNVLIIPTDVSNLDQVVRLKDKVYDTWGEVSTNPPSPPFIPSQTWMRIVIVCPLAGCGSDE